MIKPKSLSKIKNPLKSFTATFVGLLTYSALVSGEPLTAFYLFCLFLLLTPLAKQQIFDRFNFRTSSRERFFIAVAIFLAFIFSLPPPDANQISEQNQKSAEAQSSEIQTDKENQQTQEQVDLYEVANIVDGDTIKIKIDNKTETVRIANINTPETVDPRKEVECMGQEASQKLKELLEGKLVALESDETQSDKDRYGRLIRFVFLEDKTDVGLEMIKLGLAESSPYGSFDHKFLDEYERAQNKAQAKEVGLWNPDSCGKADGVSKEAASAQSKQHSEIANPTKPGITTPSPTSNPKPTNTPLPTYNPAPTNNPAPPATPPTQNSGVVKKSKSNICHAPGTTYYNQTKNFTPYSSVDECLQSGGRLPKK